MELFFAQEFQNNNPGALKNITVSSPLRVFPNTVLIPKGEFELKQMVNTAIEELVNIGTVDSLIGKYEPVPGTFYRMAPPYRAEAK